MLKLATLPKSLAGILTYTTLFASIVLLVLAGVLGSYAFSRDPYIVEDVVVARADAVSEYGIAFLLSPNEIYGTVLAYEGKPVPVYLALAREVLLKHTFRLSYGTASGNYSLRVYVAHPDGWTKEIRSAADSFSARPTVSLSERLNVTELRSFVEGLSRQAGIRLASYSIVVVAKVDYSVALGPHVRRGSVEHRVDLEVDQTRGWIAVRGEPSQSRPVTVSTRVVTPVTLAGVPVESLRTVAPSMGVAGVALLFAYVVVFARSKETGPTVRLERKYRDLIVEGTRLPDLSSGDLVVLKDLEELVKVARLVERPVVKVSSNPGRVVYYIVDRRITYIVED